VLALLHWSFCATGRTWLNLVTKPRSSRALRSAWCAGPNLPSIQKQLYRPASWHPLVAPEPLFDLEDQSLKACFRIAPSTAYGADIRRLLHLYLRCSHKWQRAFLPASELATEELFPLLSRREVFPEAQPRMGLSSEQLVEGLGNNSAVKRSGLRYEN